MSRQEEFGREAGFTLVELLIVTVVFGVVLTGALGFMTLQHSAFMKGSDRLMTLQNLRYAYQTLEIDLTTLGSNVPEGQPAMVLADDDVIAFTGDYTSNLANDVSAVYIDLDAPNGLVQAPSVTVSIPNSSFAWPDTIYVAPGGTPSMAELIIYFFEPDVTTAQADDYVLKRQVNDASPEVLARNLLKQGSMPFFRYFRERTYTSQSSELDSIADGDLPLFHSVVVHGSATDTANSARGDSIRAVRVSFRSTNGRPGADEWFADLSRVVDLPSAGIGIVMTCGDEPILGSSLTVQVVTPDPFEPSMVRLTWLPATDESVGEKDVIRYVLYRRAVPNNGQWGDPFLSIPAGAASYTYDDATVQVGSTYQYAHAAQDCTPSLSPLSQTQQITVS